MRRPRGPGGRFLTAKEIAELEKKEAEATQVCFAIRRNKSQFSPTSYSITPTPFYCCHSWIFSLFIVKEKRWSH
jgi:hypothetical protein